MSKVAKSIKPVAAPKMPKGNDEGGKFVSRDLVKMKTAESLMPTPAEPVRLHAKMAGAC